MWARRPEGADCKQGKLGLSRGKLAPGDWDSMSQRVIEVGDSVEVCNYSAILSTGVDVGILHEIEGYSRTHDSWCHLLLHCTVSLQWLIDGHAQSKLQACAGGGVCQAAGAGTKGPRGVNSAVARLFTPLRVPQRVTGCCHPMPPNAVPVGSSSRA